MTDLCVPLRSKQREQSFENIDIDIFLFFKEKEIRAITFWIWGGGGDWGLFLFFLLCYITHISEVNVY